MAEQQDRLKQPRVAPLDLDALTDEQDEALTKLGPTISALRIFRTIAHHPRLLSRWVVFGSHLLYETTLSQRQREIVTLRTSWLCGAEYEFLLHVYTSRQHGLTDRDIEWIKAGPDAPGIDPVEAILITVADELHDNQAISDQTWSALSTHLDTQQILDLVFTVGQYTLVSMVLNTCGVQPDQHVLDAIAGG